MLTKILLLVLSTIIGFALHGCTTMAPSSQSQLHNLSWSKRSAELKNISRWSLSGVFSITHHHRTDIAYFDWERNHNNFTLEIYGPLHLTNIKIIGKPGEVFLFKTSDKVIRASSPEDLIYQETSWMLPISNLAYWIRNLPAPANISTEKTTATFDTYNHLTTLKQQGWVVNYHNFMAVGAIDLPSRLEVSTLPAMTSPESPGQLKIRMVIKSWKLPNP